MPLNATLSNVSPLLIYRPGMLWKERITADDGENYTSTSYHRTDSPANVTFSWMGSGIRVYGSYQKSGQDSYTVELDGEVTHAEEDAGILYSAANLNPDSEHKMVLSNAGGGTLDIDYLELAYEEDPVRESVDPDDSRFEFSSDWVEDSMGKSTNTSGSVALTFNGTCIAMYGTLGTNQSSFWASVDDDSPTLFRSNSNKEQESELLLYLTQNLSHESHIVRLDSYPSTSNDTLTITRADICQRNSDDSDTIGRASPSDAYGTKSRTIAMATALPLGALVIIVIGTLIKRSYSRRTKRRKSRLPRPYLQSYVSYPRRVESAEPLHPLDSAPSPSPQPSSIPTSTRRPIRPLPPCPPHTLAISAPPPPYTPHGLIQVYGTLGGS